MTDAAFSGETWSAHCALHGVMPLPEPITLRTLRRVAGKELHFGVHAQDLQAVTELPGFIPAFRYGASVAMPNEIGACERARFFAV